MMSSGTEASKNRLQKPGHYLGSTTQLTEHGWVKLYDLCGNHRSRGSQLPPRSKQVQCVHATSHLQFHRRIGFPAEALLRQFCCAP